MGPGNPFDDRSFAIDTGPLLEFLLLQFFRELGQPLGRAQKKIAHLDNVLLETAFERFMTTRGPLFSTSGVIVEIDRHVRECRLGDEHQQGFRRFMINRLQALRVEERPMRLRDMPPDLVAEFGPVDAALLTLAETSERPVTLVTVDGPFSARARRRGVECIAVHEMLALLDDS